LAGDEVYSEGARACVLRWPALRETLGVILFQEQVLKVARDLAGFTPDQGEQLRRALGSKRAEQLLSQLQNSFVAGA